MDYIDVSRLNLELNLWLSVTIVHVQPQYFKSWLN